MGLVQIVLQALLLLLLTLIFAVFRVAVSCQVCGVGLHRSVNLVERETYLNEVCVCKACY